MFFFFFDGEKKIIDKMPKGKYIFLDFETSDSKTKGICSVGYIVYNDGEIVKRQKTIVNPEAPINPINYGVHGLKQKDVEDKDNFEVVWEKELKQYFEEKYILVAHNTQGSEISCICKNADRYGFEIPEAISFYDTQKLANKNCEPSQRLEDLAKEYGIVYDAHDPLEDAEACMKMFLIYKDLGIVENPIIYNTITRENNLHKKKPSFFSTYTFGSSTNEKKGSEAFYNDYLADMEKATPNEEETELCAIIKNILIENGRNIEKVYFYKNGMGIIDSRLCWENFFRFKIAAKNRYILIDKRNALPNHEVIKYSKNEEYIGKDRMLFDDPKVIRKLTKYILNEFDKSLRACNYNAFDMSIKIVANNLNDYDTYELEENAYGRYNRRIELENEKQRIQEEKEAKRLERLKEQEIRKQIKAEVEQRKKEAIKNGTYNPHGKRPICKMDDYGNILETYESVSEAVSKTCVNSKSIRDAAKGVQRHAGGFVWKYKDQL